LLERRAPRDVSKNDSPTLTDPYASDAPPPSERPPGVPSASPTLVSGSAPVEKKSPWAEDVEKKKRRRRWAIRAASIVGAAAALGGLIAGGVFLFRRARAVPVSPGPIADLPASTVYIERLPTRWIYLDVGDLAEVPPEAGWSHYAEHFCGGSDVFQNLLRARSDGARRLVAGAIASRRDTGDALECGKRLLESHVGGTSFYVRAIVPPPNRVLEPERRDSGERPTPEWFAVDRFDVEKLPDSSRRYRSWNDKGALDGTRCLLPPGAAPRKNCGPSAQAAARIAKTDLFVSSTLEHLQYFGSEHGEGGKRRDADVLEAIEKRVGTFDAAVIGTHEGFSPSFPRRLGIAVAKSEGAGGPDDAALLGIVDETESHFGIGDGFSGAKGGRFRLELVPRRAKDADAVARALDKWRDRLVRDLDGREPDFEPLVGYTPLPTERDYRSMVHHESVDALRDAEVETEDGVVSLSVEVAYDAAGQRLAEAFLADLAERARLAAQVVDQLEKGERPDRDALLDLGGSELTGLLDRPENGVED
jgi:hypothetical protein